MKIAFISSEVYPFSKTGGLADVAGALPIELAKNSNEVNIFTPKYSLIDEEKYSISELGKFHGMPILINGTEYSINVYVAYLPDSSVTTYFIDYPPFYSRKEFYTFDEDEDLRFILFQKAVLEIIKILEWPPDIFHVNDWQSALIPYYLKSLYSEEKLFRNSVSLLTIHNIGYQGLFPKSTITNAEIDDKLFTPTGPAEFYGKVSFLKMGIVYADLINTVSETYAKELLTDELSGGLKDILYSRKKDLFGIINGVDYSIWNPETDKLIPANYSAESLEKKEKNKIALASEFDLKYDKDIPIIGIVSRLVSQKGFDLFFDLFDELIGMDARLVVLGNGDDKYETFFKKLEYFSSGNIKTHIGYNNDLAHLIEAGSDMFLMPSLYEPCGLNQIYSLKYGTVPIVRETGGLADTVLDWDKTVLNGKLNGTGFGFKEFSSAAMWKTIQRALKYFEKKSTWRIIQKNGMKKDFSWGKSASKYIELYIHGLNTKSD
jgi:starch synthase